MDDFSKLDIPDDWMLRRALFRQLEQRWGRHIVDLFASNANNQCARFYSLQCCRGSAGVNAFAFYRGIGILWINCPFRSLGRVWRKLRHDGDISTKLDPLCQSSMWWGLFALDRVYFANEIVV